MIWLYIGVAILVSIALLRKRNISFENYIWVLLPVDMYGISLAGVTVKPYMLFSLLLIPSVMIKNHGKVFVGNSRYIAIIPLLLGAMFINLFNGGTSASQMSIMMVFVVYICACVYATSIDESIKEIPEVIVATSVGYGIVFLTAYIVSLMGINLQGLTAMARNEPGILMRFSNMYSGNHITNIRLRGFNIDPNTSVGVFLAAFSVDLMKTLLGREKERIHLVSFVLSFVCIILTNSRIGIAAAIIIMLFSGRYAIKQMQGRRKQRVVISLTFLSLVLLIALVFSGIGNRALEQMSSVYGNRSGFSDQYGRGTIWQEAISIWSKDGLFFGVGVGQMQYLTSTGRACHNTWLEWICSCGIILGSAIVLYFVILLKDGFKRRREVEDKNSTLFYALLMGFFGIVCCLFTVDNITNSYLWFFAISLIKAMSVLSSHENSVDSKALTVE